MEKNIYAKVAKKRSLPTSGLEQPPLKRMGGGERVVFGKIGTLGKTLKYGGVRKSEPPLIKGEKTRERG